MNVVHKVVLEAERIAVSTFVTTSDRYKQIFNIALDKHLGTVPGLSSDVLLVNVILRTAMHEIVDFVY